MTLELLEGAVDAVADYIEANMAAKVVTLNTRYADTLLTAPVNYYRGSLPISTPESVSVVFHAEDWTPGDQRVANLQSVNNIVIVIFVGDDNVENRFRKLCRYGLGITELLRTGESTMGYIIRLRGPMALSEPLNTQPFLQAMTMPISLHAMETY